jgi:hypothetical protein
MARTTVIIRQLSGPNQVPGLNYQVWTPSSRIFETTGVTEPGPGRVDLVDGDGVVEVTPGVWFVDAYVPGGALRRAVRVPASATPVLYVDLAEVTDQVELGFGPSWSAAAMLAANESRISADKAAAALAATLVATAEGRGLRDQILKLLADAGADDPGNTIDAGEVGKAIALLDDSDPDPWILAIAGDSTGDEADEAHEAAWKRLSALWPERSWVLRRFNKATDEYAAQIVWRTGNTKDARPGTAVVLEGGTTGGAKTTKTVFSDNFRRTAADIVGTSPQVGGTWRGAVGQYRLVMIGTEGVVEIVPSAGDLAKPVGAPPIAHDGSTEGQWFTVVRISTRAAATTNLYGPYVTSTGDGMYLRMAYSTTTATHLLELVGRRAGVDRVIATVPSDAIAENTVDQFVDVTFTIAGTKATVKVETKIPTREAREASGTITAAEVAAWAPFDDVRFASTDQRFRVDYYQANATTVSQATTTATSTSAPDAGVGLQAFVYNGSIAGSKSVDQRDRLRKLYPVRPNLLILWHGLNYADMTPVQFLAELQDTVDAFHLLHPGVPVAIGTQNPRYYVSTTGAPESRVADHAARQAAIKGYAALKGWYFFADTFAAFQAAPSGGVYLVDPADGVHPIAAGRAIQAALEEAGFSAITRRGTGGTGGVLVPTGLQLEQVPGHPYLLRIKS